MKAIGALSKYRIIEKLGAGGMGEVYKGEDLALLRPVAIKVMSKQGELTSSGECPLSARGPGRIRVQSSEHSDDL